MRGLFSFMISLFTCAGSTAQVNYVKNGDLEQYSRCPDQWNRVYYANGWRNARDSTLSNVGMEYYHSCANSMTPDVAVHVPVNVSFIQAPHSGSGLAGAHFYYDKIPSPGSPPLPLPSNYRDYLQGHLSTTLNSGKNYCVTFYICMTEASGYGHNKIGAYLDNGNINISTDTPGSEILTVIPQIHTEDVITDTANWTKIEGIFTAIGNESIITIGNFYPNTALTSLYTNYWSALPGYSYYLVDDISVVESDLKANAGKDTWVEETKTVKIGPAEDTTATAIDCKWFHKGVLIDSGAVISVGATTKGNIDTYIVVQTICGNVTRDTVLVSTVGLGVTERGFQEQFSVFPNPSNGKIHVITQIPLSALKATVTDLLGKTLYRNEIDFLGYTSELQLNLSPGIYLLQISDEMGNYSRHRIIIR